MTATPNSIEPTRTRDGFRLPAPGVWEVDPGHADVAFVGRHFMLTKIRGRFTDVRGAISIADDPRESMVEVTIGMASVESGSSVRDDHLRSADLFDVARFPEATFRSMSVYWADMSGIVHGELTIHGVTRAVKLDVDYLGYAAGMTGEHRAIFSARALINREDFGITWNMALETGGVLVSKAIQIEIEVETVLQEQPSSPER
ncbi:MAG: YceI family protein [Jiangellaceae bacterium]